MDASELNTLASKHKLGSMGEDILGALLVSIRPDNLRGDSLTAKEIHNISDVGSKASLKEYLRRLRDFCDEIEIGNIITEVDPLQKTRYRFDARPQEIGKIISIKRIWGIHEENTPPAVFNEGQKVRVRIPGVAQFYGIIVKPDTSIKSRVIVSPSRPFSVEKEYLR